MVPLAEDDSNRFFDFGSRTGPLVALVSVSRSPIILDDTEMTFLVERRERRSGGSCPCTQVVLSFLPFCELLVLVEPSLGEFDLFLFLELDLVVVDLLEELLGAESLSPSDSEEDFTVS